jgi:hypothetical protein
MRQNAYLSFEDCPRSAPGPGAIFDLVTGCAHRLAINGTPACAAIMNWFPINSEIIFFKDCQISNDAE